ncbi:MAG: hypothetical protein PWP66_279 [Thermosediminibacterales bacterium]|nr:hypothetical protein [Thermosediminibacterales bacterium]
MRISYRQFPHPVLSYFSDDIVDCVFKTKLDVDVTDNTYEFKGCCKTDNEDLLNYIENKKVCFAFHVECSATRYRKIFKFFKEKISFAVPAGKLDGKVEICPLIIAAEDIDNYKNKNFNSDYGSVIFKVKKGDILAVDENVIFFADKEIDPLKKIPSIFTISADKNQDAPPIDIDATGDKVVIKLSQENFERYKILKLDQNLQSTLASLTAVPALIILLEMIKDDIKEGNIGNSEYEELRWYRIIVKKLREIGIDVYDADSFIDSSIQVAQQLIGNPLTNSLKNLEGYISED